MIRVRLDTSFSFNARTQTFLRTASLLSFYNGKTSFLALPYLNGDRTMAKDDKPSFMDYVMPALKSYFSGYITDAFRNMEHKMEKAVERVQKNVMRGILIGSLFMGGIAMLFLGIVFLLAELTILSLGGSFAIVGIALLFVSMLFMLLNR